MRKPDTSSGDPLSAFLPESETVPEVTEAPSFDIAPFPSPSPIDHGARDVLIGVGVISVIAMGVLLLEPPDGSRPLGRLPPPPLTARAVIPPQALTVRPGISPAVAEARSTMEAARGTTGTLSEIGSVTAPRARSPVPPSATDTRAAAVTAPLVTAPVEDTPALTAGAAAPFVSNDSTTEATIEAANVESAVPARIAPPSVAATTAIHRTLDAYRQSYNNLDATAASLIWVGLDTRALQRAFASLTSQDLAFDRCDVDLSTDATRATATCSGMLNYVRKVGSNGVHERRLSWTIDLVRSGESWLIERVTAR